ncbi:MAG TPA: DinB family protein [Acidimicrobiia bacterium]|nr:DinB family protein [Acidimicrobiia bacterium]
MRQRHLDPAVGYEPLVGRFVAMLEETRSRLWRDLEDFDVGQLDRTPPGSPNSIGTLLYHIAAIELDWLYADLLETDFPEGVDEWFPVDVREDGGRLTPVVEPLERHRDRLGWVRERLLDELRGVTDADLDRTHNPGPNECGGAWILHHLMQHEAEHRGQIGEVRANLGKL